MRAQCGGKARKFLNDFLASRGLTLAPARYIPRIKPGNDLLGGLIGARYTEAICPVLAPLPLSKGRSSPFFSWSTPTAHPFGLAAHKASGLRLREDRLSAIRSSLDAFYRRFQPSSFGALFQLPKYRPGPVWDAPAWGVPLPWQGKLDIESWVAAMEHSSQFESRRFGFHLSMDQDGWTWGGPVSEKKLQLETLRLEKVLTSVQVNGYGRNDAIDGDVTGIVLLAENGTWVWQSDGGQHRAAVASALDFVTLPVRVALVAREAEIEFWPQVRNGLFTVEEAQEVFTAVLRGVSWDSVGPI